MGSPTEAKHVITVAEERQSMNGGNNIAGPSQRRSADIAHDESQSSPSQQPGHEYTRKRARRGKQLFARPDVLLANPPPTRHQWRGRLPGVVYRSQSGPLQRRSASRRLAGAELLDPDVVPRQTEDVHRSAMLVVGLRRGQHAAARLVARVVRLEVCSAVRSGRTKFVRRESSPRNYVVEERYQGHCLLPVRIAVLWDLLRAAASNSTTRDSLEAPAISQQHHWVVAGGRATAT
jgi:hypothetical protein